MLHQNGIKKIQMHSLTEILTHETVPKWNDRDIHNVHHIYRKVTFVTLNSTPDHMLKIHFQECMQKLPVCVVEQIKMCVCEANRKMGPWLWWEGVESNTHFVPCLLVTYSVLPTKRSPRWLVSLFILTTTNFYCLSII